MEEIEENENLPFIDELIEITDREAKRTKQSHILIVKVWWNAKEGSEFTWEHEDQMKQKYPHLIPSSLVPTLNYLQDKIPPNGGMMWLLENFGSNQV